MREHIGLFRGKRIDNGEWVEGNLVNYNPHFEWVHITYFAEDDGGFLTRFEAEVIPDTVGECTGLKDKSGKLIFEGDIVHCVARLDEANCVVIYEQGEFRLVPERYYKTYVTGGGYHALWCFDKEIIGNIHDNKNLLSGQEVEE